MIDQDAGTPPADQARIFDPIFTTKPSGKVTGLGLSTCWSIVQDHLGTLVCHCRPGKGTTYGARLPFDPERADSSAAEG